jgi:benzoyl-CoA reductase/2-hydroxyglutaryl-CoA dehydratase subunit BcrC/BadD/HgdB
MKTTSSGAKSDERTDATRGLIERFRAMAETAIPNWRHRFPDSTPLGIYNAYVPEELFYAAGLVPVYLFHQAVDHGHSRLHLPSFACWPGRSLVDQAVSGTLDGVAGLALSQTCDMVQALGDIWRVVMPSTPLYFIGFPAHLGNRSTRPYLVAELAKLRRDLGDISDAAIYQALGIYEHTRLLVNQVYDRAEDLAPTELYSIIRAGLRSPRKTFNDLLQTLLGVLPRSCFRGPRVILVGPHLADETVYATIETAGGRVVGDLLDVGQRYFVQPTATKDDPIVALAERMLRMVPTPTKYNPRHRRDRALVDRVTACRAHGVIFSRQKFCDPHGFDYAQLKRLLDAQGIPHLLLELEQSSQAGQIQTRVEAFFETMAL